MNDKYATLSLIQLKELAKSQGVKNVSTMRKAQLVQLMGELEEKYNRETTAKNKDSEKTPVSTERTDLRSERGPETSDDGEIRMDSSLDGRGFDGSPDSSIPEEDLHPFRYRT